MASVELIRFFVSPKAVVPIGIWDCEPEIYLPEEPEVPYWDGDRLWYREDVIKQFTKPAENQRKVLDAFQEAGWPSQLQNPFVGQNFDFAHAAQTLNDTKAGLNDGPVTPGILRFGILENGDLMIWEATSG